MRGEEKKINQLLKDYLKAYRLEKKFLDATLQADWEKICGKTIAKYTKSVRVENRKLIIQVVSAPLRENLLYAQQEIITMVNEYYNEKMIDNVEVW